MKYISYQRIKNEILKAGTPPRTTALSLAIGIWLAFSPFPGLHLIIGFVILKSFRLNSVVLIVGIMLHNPWTMIPIHTFGLLVGDLLLNGSFTSLAQFRLFPWEELGLATVFNRAFWQENGPLLLLFFKPFAVGSLIVSTSLSSISFCTVHHILKKKPPQEVSP